MVSKRTEWFHKTFARSLAIPLGLLLSDGLAVGQETLPADFDGEEHCLLQRPRTPAREIEGGVTAAPERCPYGDKACAVLKTSGAKVLCGAEAQHYDLGAFNTKCASLVPAYVLLPTNGAQVQKAVRIMRRFGLNISVRGGGHNYVCDGFKAGSMHLDMRGMKDFAWREADGYGFAKMGPGNTLASMATGIPPGYQYAIGTCPHVGVAGYLIHGGSSPRTRWLGNTTLYSMDVVTADGHLVTLTEGSAHPDLWMAMRQAGSSFGVVTSLTIRLEAVPQKDSWLLPTNGSFEELLDIVFDPSFVERTDAAGVWIGLVRWDGVAGQGWNFKIAAHRNFSDSPLPQPNLCRGSIDEAGVAAFYHSLERRLPGRAPTEEAVRRTLCLLAEAGLPVDAQAAAQLPPEQAAYEENIWEAKAWLRDPVKAPCDFINNTCPDAASSGGFYAADVAKAAAQSQYVFYKTVSPADCSFDLGPLKGPGERVFLDNSCYTPTTVAKLAPWLGNHQNLKGFQKYFNLPAWGARQHEYWPNYAELAAIKARWDPSNVFNIPDGIHPPGWPWPSYDPFA